MFSFSQGASLKMARSLIRVTGTREALALFLDKNLSTVDSQDLFIQLLALNACNLLQTLKEGFISDEINLEDGQDIVDDYVIETLRRQDWVKSRDGGELMDRCQEILGIAEKFQSNWEEGAEKPVLEPLYLSVMDVLRKFGSEGYFELQDSLYQFVNQQHQYFTHYFRNLLMPFGSVEAPAEPAPEPEIMIPVTTDPGPPLPVIVKEEPPLSPAPDAPPAEPSLPNLEDLGGPGFPMIDAIPVETPALPLVPEATPAEPVQEVSPAAPLAPRSPEGAGGELESLGQPAFNLTPQTSLGRVLPPLEPVRPETPGLAKDPFLQKPKEPVFPEQVQEAPPVPKEASPDPGEELVSLVQPVSHLSPQIESLPAPRPVPSSLEGEGGSLEGVGGEPALPNLEDLGEPAPLVVPVPQSDLDVLVPPEPTPAEPPRDLLPASVDTPPLSQGLESLVQRGFPLASRPDSQLVGLPSPPLASRPVPHSLLGDGGSPEGEGGIAPVLESFDIDESKEGKKVLPPLELALPEGLEIISDPSMPKPKEPVFPEPFHEVSPALVETPAASGGSEDLVQPEPILPPEIETQLAPPLSPVAWR